MPVFPLAVFFSTPAAALATAAVAGTVPLVIHLLSRRRYRVTDWAAMRFLLAAVKRHHRRLRLEQWLLLAARTLLVLLPALAMAAAMPWAEPFWQRLFPGAAAGPRFVGRTHHVVVIDGSLSMSARRDDGSPFERAQAAAGKIIRGASGGDGFSLIELATPPRVIVPGPANDPGRVAREIDDLRCTHSQADLAQALQAADDALSRPGGQYARRVVYILTDLQRSQWSAPPTPTGTWNEPWQRLNTRADVALIDVGAGPAENLAVTSVALADAVVTAGARTALTATVQNFGLTDRSGVRVEFAQAKSAASGRVAPGDEPYPPRVLRQELVDLPAGGSATLSVPVEFRGPGDYRIDVRVETDALEADDRRSMTVTVRETLPVLVVNGRPAADPFESAAGWLAAALNPFPDSTPHAAYPARVKVVDAARLDEPELDLNRFDCVFLAELDRPTARDRERIDAYLRRGGTVVISPGPRADPEAYARALDANGDGPLPARLMARQRAAAERFFSIAADNGDFRRPPLAAFAADDDRAALLAARFKEYWRIEVSPKAPTPRKLLTLLPPAPAGDALFYEWSRGRGRVVLFTSTFSTEWTGWPVAPSFPPFVQELLRHSARQPPRRDLLVGEPIDEYLPDGTATTEAKVSPPNGSTVTVPLGIGDDAPRLRFVDTDRAGIYTAAVTGQPPRVFAVNVMAGGESDLTRAVPADLPATGTGEDAQIVTDPSDIRHRPPDPEVLPAIVSDESGVLGSAVARGLLLAALALLFIEPVLAWRFGSARGPINAIDRPAETPARRARNALLAFAAAAPLVLIGIGGLILLHASLTGELLSFLPGGVRRTIEASLGVPAAIPGEGTRWRFERLPVFTDVANADRWLVGVLAVAALALSVVVYRQELQRSSRLAGGPLVLLRCGLVLVTLLVLLPQLRLVFEREGWPDLVVLMDDSQSMGVADEFADPAARDVVAAVAGKPSPTRLELAQALLTRGDHPWLAGLVGRQARLHIYRVSDRLSQAAVLDEPNDVARAAKSINTLQATGRGSRLGDAVRGLLQEFRGSALAGIVILTDGITTEGEELGAAARHAARAGVPLTLVGLGDAREPKDMALTDLRVDDVVHVGDRLVFEARLTPRGGLTGAVTVKLSEKRDDGPVEVARQQVTTDAAGAPSKVRLVYAPKEPGERTFVLEATAQPGETDLGNNVLERTVTVAEFRRTRVLFIEGRPRYDFRFVKTLLERETEVVRGNKSIELRVLLTDADPDFARTDRTALAAFPPTRDELFAQFDAVILGDVDPHHPLLGEKHLQWLAEFVREKGGGLLALAGPQFMPVAYRDTPLASVLPVDTGRAEPGGVSRATGYKPRLTAIGRTHPAFRFAPDEQENVDVWNRLKPFLWAAAGLRPKPAAEVLATLPPEKGTGEGDPLVVQQFAGAGRVMLVGYEEAWRWRFRTDEPRFNQYWIQLVRYLARTRPSRPELRLDRQTAYRRGEPIRVTVRFPDDKPAPPADAPVKVMLERTQAGGAVERLTLQLASAPGGRGAFETIVTRTPEGQYTFTLATIDGGRPPSAEARVLPPPGEMDRLRLNRTELERAAQVSRGRFYTIADADKMIDELPPLPRVTLHQPRPPWPVWNTPAVFVLALTLVGGEWVLRKRQQLL